MALPTRRTVSPPILLAPDPMPLSFVLRSADAAAVNTRMLVILLPSGRELPKSLASLNERLGGALKRSLSRQEFRGGRDEMAHFTGRDSGPARVMLVGMGTVADRLLALRRAATLAARQAHRMGTGELALLAPDAMGPDIEALVVGASLGCWEYLDLRTPPPAEERRAPLEKVTLLVGDVKSSRAPLSSGEAMADGYAVARRLAQMPGNVCTPDLLADMAREIGARHKLQVTVLGRKEMEKAGMGSFLCVAQGTPQEPRLIAIEYRGGARDERPIVLVGKGLCFDTGGISIKPAERMEFMKFDMCGGAGVLGAMEAIARMALKVNVVGLVGATTNMPSGVAIKPGDVVRAANGKSIEIINTDAEGRLVLADVLHYAARYKPIAVIDAATLTGACVVALGNSCTGALGNDDALVDEVIRASRRASEPAWQLPLWDDYREQIKSDVADIKNTGGRAGGAITAAAFLKEFVTFPWVHLDIAGTAYSESDLVIVPKGPTGVPVGTFVEFVRGRAT